MVVSNFCVLDKDGRERFFEESFLLADVKPEIVFEMLFLTMSNAIVNFQDQNLQWRSYTTKNVLPTTRQIELIEKKKFAIAALDLEHEAFVVYVTALNADSGNEVHPLRRAQIVHLKEEKAPSKVPSKYADFADIFSPKLAVELPEYMRINDHAIELVND